MVIFVLSYEAIIAAKNSSSVLIKSWLHPDWVPSEVFGSDPTSTYLLYCLLQLLSL